MNEKTVNLSGVLFLSLLLSLSSPWSMLLFLPLAFILFILHSLVLFCHSIGFEFQIIYRKFTWTDTRVLGMFYRTCGVCPSTSTLDTILCTRQHRKSGRGSKKRSKEKCLRKYAFAVRFKWKHADVFVCAKYFRGVSIFSAFLTVSMGMRWLFWPIASWQIYEAEDGFGEWTNIQHILSIPILLEWRETWSEMFRITAATTRAVAAADAESDRNWDIKLNIIGRKCQNNIEFLHFLQCNSNSNSLYDRFYFLCPLIQKYNGFRGHLFGSKIRIDWPTAI